MLNFFAIVLVIFIGILLLVFKKRSFKKFINKRNLYSIKLNKNNKFPSNKNSFLCNREDNKSTQYFIKILKEIKCLVFLKVIKMIN